MTTLIALLLAAAAAPRGSAQVERTYSLAKLTAADAARLVGKRARFRISLDSAAEEAGTPAATAWRRPAWPPGSGFCPARRRKTK
jgi:hypothetical protein